MVLLLLRPGTESRSFKKKMMMDRGKGFRRNWGECQEEKAGEDWRRRPDGGGGNRPQVRGRGDTDRRGRTAPLCSYLSRPLKIFIDFRGVMERWTGEASRDRETGGLRGGGGRADDEGFTAKIKRKNRNIYICICIFNFLGWATSFLNLMQLNSKNKNKK